MRDEDKTKVQLLDELAEMRQRVTQIEASKRDRREGEQALREAEEPWRSLAELTPDHVVTVDMKGVITWASASTARVTGYSKDEIVGKHFSKLPFLRAADIPRYLGLLDSLVRGKVPEVFEVTWYNKQGNRRWSEVRASLMKDGGWPVGIQAIARQTTELRQADDALRKSEERYRALFEGSRDGVYVSTRDGKLLDANHSFLDLFGYTREEMMRLQAQQLYADPDDRPRFQEAVEQAGAVRDYQTKLRKKDGTEMDCLLTSTVWLAKDGSVLGYQGIIRDITEKKRAEQALRESEEKYRDLVENIDDVIYSVDHEGVITYVSPAIESFLGYSPAEVTGHPFMEFIHEEDLQRIRKSYERVLSGHSPGPNEYRVVTKSGEIRWMRTSSRPIFAGNRAIAVRGVLANITDRKEAEQALRESEEKYRNLVERASDGIAIIQDATVRFANQRLAEMWGGTVQEVIGTPFADYVHPDALPQVVDRHERRMAGENVTAVYETVLRRRDGSEVYAELNAGLITYDGKVADLVFVRDLSERRRAQDELRRSYDRLGRTLEQTINALAAAVEMRDVYTAGHQRRVADLACAMAEEMSVSEDQIRGIRMAGLIHDVGKIYVPGEILSKPTRLSEPEFAMVRTHPQAGYDILRTVEFPWPVAQIVLQHHERMDRSGYPQGLSGDEILLEARILAVADVVEAMASHRPYRPAHTLEEALEEISQNSGVLYDPQAADACLRLFTEKDFKLD